MKKIPKLQRGIQAEHSKSVPKRKNKQGDIQRVWNVMVSILQVGEKVQRSNLLKKYDANDKSEYVVIYKQDYAEQIKYVEEPRKTVVQETSQATTVQETTAESGEPAATGTAKKKT